MIRVDEKHPDVIALRHAEMKLNEVLVRHQAKRSELDELTNKYLQARKLSRIGRLEAEAHSLLSGLGDKADLSHSDVERAQHDVEVLAMAVAEQRQIVDTLRGKYSLVVCDGNRHRYIDVERRIAKAVKELAEANEEEVKFFHELEAVGASIRFRPMRLNEVGLASDPQSRANFHRREVEEFLPEAAVS